MTLVLTLVSVGSPVAADTLMPGPSGGAFIDDNGTPTATAHDEGSSPGAGAGGGGSGEAEPAPCRWEVAIEDDAQMAIYDADTLETLHSNTGRWLQYACEGMGPVPIGGEFVIPEGGLVDPAALAADALASIAIRVPGIRTSPEAPDLYVQVATWLGIEEDWWHPYEATATTGSVSVTVRAEPTSTTFDTGDGSIVRCEGPGAAWAGEVEPSADCTHTYRSSHAELTITATVDLEVSWTSNIGAGGELGPISRSSSVDAHVGEIQATGEN